MSIESMTLALRRFFFGDSRSISARLLVEQIKMSLRLHPVSILGQMIAACVIVARFWHSLNRPMLVAWLAAVCASVWAWGILRRQFQADTEREAHVRNWIKRWMLYAAMTGTVWGFAGSAFLATKDTINLIVLVSVIVAVTFASWPAFSCWIPSLTVVMVLSLAPMVVTLAAAYDVGSLSTGGILLVLLVFVLYCGRQLNNIVTTAVMREVQNERLVARLKSEKTLAESARRATAAASARRAQFFAGANHDLRQPLQAMGIYLQILQMQTNDANRPIVEQLSAAAKSISTLVEQILEVSRIETGHVEVKNEDVRLDALFADLERDFAPVAAVKGLQFSTRPLPVTVHTDPVLVTRILRNLITNAIGYTTRPGGRVVLGARRLRDGRLSVGVYDQGPGIAPEERGRIFDAFYRGRSGKQGQQGYGLGLSIVIGLAKKLGLAVTVGSRVGRGSVFRLIFDGATSEAGGGAASGLPITMDLDLRGVVGLLEDNDIVREAVGSILTSWGATVLSARTPDKTFVEAMIEHAQKGNLTALLSDYNLGDEMSSGLEVIFSVRMGAGRHFPCVLLTAVSEDEIRHAYRTLCLNPDNTGQSLPVILQKPVSTERLASALRQAIAENRQARCD